MRFRILPAALALCCAIVVGFASPAFAADTNSASSAAPVLSTGAPSSDAAGVRATKTVPDGIYTIATAISPGMLVEVPGANTRNGVQAALYAENATPAQRWRLSANADGFYTIVNVATGRALDVPAQRAVNAQKVQQYTANNTRAQLWRIEAAADGAYTIHSAVDDTYVLDVPAQRATRGQKIQLYSSNDTPAQRFVLTRITQQVSDGVYVVKNKKSSRALDVAAGSTRNGGNVQQYASNGTLAQAFRVAFDKTTGYYTIIGAGSGKVLDVASGSTRSGANVQQYASNGTLAQRWDITKESDGSFTIRSAKSGHALEVQWGSAANGANVRIYASNGTDAQKWSLAAQSSWLPEGTYLFRSAKASKNVLDVKAASVANGGNVQVWAGNGTNAQRFYVRSTGNGAYTIQNVYSGKYVGVAANSSGSNVVQSSTRTQWKPVVRTGGIVFQLANNTKVVLDVAGGSKASGANVQVYTSNATAAQKWLLSPTNLLADGTYTIAPSSNTRFVMDNPGQSRAAGTQMQVYTANKTLAQNFRLAYLGSGLYRITNAASNLSLAASASKLVQQAQANSNAQKWRLGLSADGSITVSSAVNAQYKATLSGKAANAAKVAVASSPASSQGWVFRSAPTPLGTTTYDTLSITMSQMASIEGASVASLNPSNLSKYQFLDLRTYTGTSAADLDRALQNLAPWIGPGNPLHQSGKYFVEAAKKYNVNEVFLLVHAGQETGWGEAAYFGGYYNFFGVDGGAATGAAAASNAASRGWTSIEKGIVGGTQFLAEEWVFRKNYPQHSPYALRFDYFYADKARAYSFHHYTTSDVWLATTADHIKQVYDFLGTGSSACFVYPKYKS